MRSVPIACRTPYLTAVITCFNEEKTIQRFVDGLIRALDETRIDYEVILVNDGSADQTFAVIAQLFEERERIRAVLDLMKNSGQAAAITAGLGEARGDYVLMMDSDLQFAADDVELLVTEARNGADVVNGHRTARRDSLRRKLPSLVGNFVMRRVAGAQLRDFGCTFRVINHRLIKAFALGPERILSIPLLISRADRIVEVPVQHVARTHGKSGWTFKKLWLYNADNTVVLIAPIFQWMGLMCIGVAALLLLRVVLDSWIHWSILGNVSNGLILNAVAVTALIVTGLVCVVGEFVVRCHRSVLARPAYVIRERRVRFRDSLPTG